MHALGQPVIASGEDSYRAWDGRGDVTAVQMAGECGHNWTLCIGFHKGESFLFVSRALAAILGRK